MAQTFAAPVVGPRTHVEEPQANSGFSVSGVSWAAVMGGAVAASAISLILLALGTGIGFSSVSPWTNSGAAASSFEKVSILWLAVSQIVASSLGGYLAGRLRTKWVNLHTDEVYFRDTAHGFLAWATGLIFTAALMGIAVASMAGGAAQAVASKAGASADSNAYYVDALFRSDRPSSTNANDAAMHSEVGAIFANDLRQPETPAADQAYLAQLVAAQTGLSQSDAQQRVTSDITQARQAADTARKAAAHLSYWTFFALLAGAFFASLAATFGGRQRDSVKPA